MGQRSKAPGRPYTRPRRKSVRPKRRSASKAARPQLTGTVVPDTDFARLRRELDEALAQQAATAKVLEVISRSAFDLQAVFDAVVESSARLCAAERAFFFRLDGELLRTTATYNVSTEVNEWFERNPIRVDGKSITGRSALKRRTINVTDVLADPDYKYPAKAIETYRSFLAVPVLKGIDLLGVISLYHPEVKPFTDRQVAVVETFAHQAAIAIENVRLFEAEQQRTRELTELLEQQTATSEVLQVISSSPGDLKPVFEAMLENAVRICGASFGSMFLFEGEHLRRVAMHNAPASYAEYAAQRPVIHYRVSGGITRVRNSRRPEQTLDLVAEDRNDPLAKFAGARTVVTMPMLKHDELIGIITIYRREVRPFTDKQVELLTNFAAQAVIAIENARLLTELRESLEQQTAMSEVLDVISRSAFDLQAVFDTVVERSARLSGAEGVRALTFRFDGELLRPVATFNVPEDVKEWLDQHPIRPGQHSGAARAALERRTIHIPDILADPGYSYGAKAVEPYRTVLAVPIVKVDDLLGIILIYLLEVKPFTDKQIALVEVFADQAAIAIENVRLFEAEQQRTRELTELLEQQTATSEVLQVISSSPGDLEPVFSSMLKNAVRICDASFGNIYRWDGDALHHVSSRNTPAGFARQRSSEPFRPPPINPVGQMIAAKTVVHLPDAAASQAYAEREPVTVAGVEIAGIRTFLAVPMLKENELIGAIALARQDVRPFTEKQIELVTNFAAQAVIAIENTRLLTELRETLEQQTAAAEVLRAISSSPGDLQPVFAALLKNATRLCEEATATCGSTRVTRFVPSLSTETCRRLIRKGLGLGRYCGRTQSFQSHALPPARNRFKSLTFA